MSRASAAAPSRVHRKTEAANWQQWITETPAAQVRPAAVEEIAPAVDVPFGNGHVSLEAIARLAYTMWEARGCPHGSPEVDWLQAERELRSHANG